jgi:hypothetical protein
MVHNRATVCTLLFHHPRRARRGTSGSSTRHIVGREKQLSSRAATWFNIKFPVKMTSYGRWDTDEVGVTCDRMPILFMRSTSPRLEVGMCASGWAAIRLLPVGRGLLVVAFCLGGLTIKGNLHLRCTSSINRARRPISITTIYISSIIFYFFYPILLHPLRHVTKWNGYQ